MVPRQPMLRFALLLTLLDTSSGTIQKTIRWLSQPLQPLGPPEPRIPSPPGQPFRVLDYGGGIVSFLQSVVKLPYDSDY